MVTYILTKKLEITYFASIWNFQNSGVSDCWFAVFISTSHLNQFQRILNHPQHFFRVSGKKTGKETMKSNSTSASNILGKTRLKVLSNFKRIYILCGVNRFIYNHFVRFAKFRMFCLLFNTLIAKFLQRNVVGL